MKIIREQMFISCLHSKIYGQNHRMLPTPQPPSPSLSILHHPPFITPQPIFNTPSLLTLIIYPSPPNIHHPSPYHPCPIKNRN